MNKHQETSEPFPWGPVGVLVGVVSVFVRTLFWSIERFGIANPISWILILFLLLAVAGVALTILLWSGFRSPSGEPGLIKRALRSMRKRPVAHSLFVLLVALAVKTGSIMDALGEVSSRVAALEERTIDGAPVSDSLEVRALRILNQEGQTVVDLSADSNGGLVRVFAKGGSDPTHRFGFDPHSGLPSIFVFKEGVRFDGETGKPIHQLRDGHFIGFKWEDRDEDTLDPGTNFAQYTIFEDNNTYYSLGFVEATGAPHFHITDEGKIVFNFGFDQSNRLPTLSLRGGTYSTTKISLGLFPTVGLLGPLPGVRTYINGIACHQLGFDETGEPVIGVASECLESVSGGGALD